jgi:hypothetical protein
MVQGASTRAGSQSNIMNMDKASLNLSKITKEVLMMKVGNSGRVMWGPIPSITSEKDAMEFLAENVLEDIGAVLQSQPPACFLSYHMLVDPKVLKFGSSLFFVVTPVEDYT